MRESSEAYYEDPKRPFDNWPDRGCCIVEGGERGLKTSFTVSFMIKLED